MGVTRRQNIILKISHEELGPYVQRGIKWIFVRVLRISFVNIIIPQWLSTLIYLRDEQ
jgi:hypothetical protein